MMPEETETEYVKNPEFSTFELSEKWEQIKTVCLLSIYDKSEKENLTDKELDELLEEVPE